MAVHVFQYSEVSKPKFVIPIEHLVNQQCMSTNASIVVSSAATMSECQPLEYILLPEHSRHVKFRAMGSASLFGWGGRTTDRSNRRKSKLSPILNGSSLDTFMGQIMYGNGGLISMLMISVTKGLRI